MRIETVVDRIVAGLKESFSKRARFQCAQTLEADEDVILMKVNRNFLFRIVVMQITDEDELQETIYDWNQHSQMDL